MNRLLKILVLFAFALAAGFAVRATYAGKEPGKAARNACTKDKPCADCSGMGACSRTCKGGGCAFSHSGLGAAEFYCDGGKCTMDHSGNGRAVLHCSGGACKATCTGNGECKIVDCKEGCAIDCKGNGHCSSS